MAHPPFPCKWHTQIARWRRDPKVSHLLGLHGRLGIRHGVPAQGRREIGHASHFRWQHGVKACSGSVKRSTPWGPSIQKGYSSTYLAVGFANVWAGIWLASSYRARGLGVAHRRWGAGLCGGQAVSTRILGKTMRDAVRNKES